MMTPSDLLALRVAIRLLDECSRTGDDKHRISIALAMVRTVEKQHTQITETIGRLERVHH